MTPSFSGSLSTGDAPSRAAALAGALAEAGITTLELERGDKLTVQLGARDTDLPGELARTGWNAIIRACDHTVIIVSPSDIQWVTQDAGIADAMRRMRA